MVKKAFCGCGSWDFSFQRDNCFSSRRYMYLKEQYDILETYFPSRQEAD